MFKNSSLKTKLMSFALGLTALTLMVAAIGYFSLSKVAGEYSHISGRALPASLALADMRTNAMAFTRNVTFLSMPSLSKADREEYEKKLNFRVESFENAQKEFLAVEKQNDLSTQVIANWKKVQDLGFEVVKLNASLEDKDHVAAATLLRGDFDDAMDNLTKSIRALNDAQALEAKANVDSAQIAQKVANTVVVFASIFAIGIALIVAILFSRALINAIAGVTTHLSTGAQELNNASKQIADTSQELSASVTQQAAAIQETASSVDQVSAMVNKNAENAKRSQQASGSSNDAAKKGKEVVGQMIQSIDEINQSNSEIMQQIESSNREISEIVKVISEIGNKTKVINDIVFQTKLLSFNASVEAARAGEHGKGFAVVAEEVGNLAQMSGNAAKEISQMLEGSIQKVERIVSETQTKIEKLVLVGKEKVNAGSETAKLCGEVLDEIVEHVTKVNQMMGEITSASEEQAQGVQEITKAMGQLDQATQQNATSSQQATTAVEHLAEQSSALRGVVSTLEQVVAGKTRGAMADHGPVAQKRAPLGKAPKNVTTLSSVKKPILEKSKEPASAKVPSQDDPRFDVA